jgi:hypothetical protein
MPLSDDAIGQYIHRYRVMPAARHIAGAPEE